MKNIPLSYFRTPIVIIATAFFIAICLMFGTCNPERPTVKLAQKEIINAERQVNAIDKIYHSENRKFETKSDSLEKEIFLIKQKLSVAKNKLLKSEKSLLILAKKDTTGKSTKDQLRDCDTLKSQVFAFTGMVDSMRSGYECSIEKYENLVATKDSEIVICQNSYSALKSITDENLDRERELTKSLQTAYKAQKRKTIQNKLLAGGMLLLSGITTTLYINAKK